MGAGKEAPTGAGGDGAGKEAAAEPVVLRMVLHCDGCAKKVKKSIHRMPGVVSVTADAKANTVVVAGTADAAALKARIESKTKKPVEILSGGGSAGPNNNKPPPAEPKKSPDKDGEQKRSPDTGGAADNSKGVDKAGSSQTREAEKGKKQPPEEKKPVEETREALLRIRLHCDGCADRIRRRIYKIKGVKDVILEGNAKDEVKVVGTMDVAAMVAYLNEKLNRTVEAVAPGKKGEEKRGEKQQKDKSAAAAGDGAHKDKGKGVEVAGPSMASAAASMAPAPVMASTHHVSPYGYGHVAYPPPQPQGPPPGYYSSSYYGGNADGAGYATPYYQQQPTADAGSYYHQPPSADNGSYYQHQPANTGSYYQHPGGFGYDQHPNPPAYNPFDTAPPPQMFSDENPNSCSVM